MESLSQAQFKPGTARVRAKLKLGKRQAGQGKVRQGRQGGQGNFGEEKNFGIFYSIVFAAEQRKTKNEKRKTNNEKRALDKHFHFCPDRFAAGEGGVGALAAGEENCGIFYSIVLNLSRPSRTNRFPPSHRLPPPPPLCCPFFQKPIRRNGFTSRVTKTFRCVVLVERRRV